MSAHNNPNTVYVAAPDEKTIDVQQYHPNQAQRNMQPGQSEQHQQQVYMQHGQDVVDEKQVAVTIQDFTEKTVFK